jgi:lysophospholipid acyltransferase (LPLAT)-like uncharacterized protein
MLKAVLRSPAVTAVLGQVIAAYLRFALATTRWTVLGDEHMAGPAMSGRIIAAFWHEMLGVMPVLFRHARRRNPALRATAMASRHRDGRLIGAVLRALGVGVAYGSTAKDGRERGGSAAARDLIGVIERGEAAAITPDGPRGPARRASLGVAQLAALSGAPVLPVAVMVQYYLRLPTWDRMILPLPFGRGVLVAEPPVAVARDGAEAALPVIQAGIEVAAARAAEGCR